MVEVVIELSIHDRVLSLLCGATSTFYLPITDHDKSTRIQWKAFLIRGLKDTRIGGKREIITIPINQRWEIYKTKGNKIHCRRLDKKSEFGILFVPKRGI